MKKSRRRKNIKIQLHNKINELLRIGVGKERTMREWQAECEKKGIAYHHSESPYIHSIETVDAYRRTVNDFSHWLKENKREVWDTKDLNSITKNSKESLSHVNGRGGCQK